MAIVWKRTKPRHTEFDAMVADVEYRTRVASEDERASPRDLYDLRRCPLVRAAMTRTRSSRGWALALAVGVPLAAWLAHLILRASPGTSAAAGWLAVIMVCLWPAVCFLGAAFSAAGAVVAEREQETAIQLVLTPIAKRDIVASVILPAIWPYVWGPVALLPLYMLVGSHQWMRLVDMTPLTVMWPVRMLLPLAGTPDVGLSLSGALIGLIMGLTDAAIVWAGANWGAVYALRVGQLTTAALLMSGRVLLTAGYELLCGLAFLLAAEFLGSALGAFLSLASPTAQWIAAILLVLGTTLPILGWFIWRVLLVWPLRAALHEFTYFDWLAFDDYRPEPWRGWDFFRIRGDRV